MDAPHPPTHPATFTLLCKAESHGCFPSFVRVSVILLAVNMVPVCHLTDIHLNTKWINLENHSRYGQIGMQHSCCHTRDLHCCIIKDVHENLRKLPNTQDVFKF